MHTIASILSSRAPEILERWAEEAMKAAAARGLTRPELMNLMPVYLKSLGRPRGEPSRREQIELVESHLSARVRAGFNPDEVIDEFALLRRVIVTLLAGMAPEDRPEVLDLEQLFADLQEAMVVVERAFRQYLLEDEQTERRYLRLLYAPFAEPYEEDPPLSQARLKKALLVVMEAMAADTAALLLYEPKTRELVMAASAGLADEPLARYARSLDPSSFVGAVAESERPTSMHDVETTPLDVPDTLRHSGIRSLLGIRLPQQRLLLGVLYIGLREERPFTPRDVRRIEAIGEGLSLHLDNARLYAALRDQIEALHVERQHREQFVAILAHDLRGPLSTAKLATDLLVRKPAAEGPASLDRRFEMILRNLARADRMVTDLLDAEAVGAGKQLVLHLAEADLGAIAREVVDELGAQHPGRFVLQADEGVRGIWGAAELRRAVWNLASNAIKYGADGAPITVTVTRRQGGAELRVHNEGAPIPLTEQATLFEPFTRAKSTRGNKDGWGLGLALVRGCAEAHGGSVQVESAPGLGTTFTLRLPEDARAAQQAGEGEC